MPTVTTRDCSLHSPQKVIALGVSLTVPVPLQANPAGASLPSKQKDTEEPKEWHTDAAAE